MKKRWFVLPAVFALGAALALPVRAADLDAQGDVRIRGFYFDNLVDGYDEGAVVDCSSRSTSDCDDQTAYNSLRFMMTLTATAGLAKGVVTLDFASLNHTGNLRFGSAEFGPLDDTFALREAYLAADLRLAVLAGGRQALKLGHGLILDDYVDGFTVDIPLGPALLTLMDLKIRDITDSSNVFIGVTGSGTSKDTDFYGGNLRVRTGDAAVALFMGFLNDRNGNLAAATSDLDFFLIGASADVTVGPLVLGGEIDFMEGAATVAGVDRDLDGLNVQASGGVHVGPATVGLTVIYASGDDPDDSDLNINGISGNYATGLILTSSAPRGFHKDGTCLSMNGTSLGTQNPGGLNCFNGSGLVAVKGSAGLRPLERLDLQGNLIYARSAKDRSTANRDSDIGVELDGIARIRLDDNLSLEGGVAYLFVGDWWKFSAGDPNPDDIILVQAGMNFRF